MLVDKLESLLVLNWTDEEKLKLTDLISSVKKYKWFIPKSLESLIVECLDICHNTLHHLQTQQTLSNQSPDNINSSI